MIVDFHSHILPKVDHGSDSMETSLKQLALAREHGVTDIVATSHFYPQSRSSATFFERRDEAYKRLMDSSREFGTNILLGAEVLVCNAIDTHPDIDRLCIAGTRTILLELPFSDFQSDFCKSVFNLVDRGYDVVMAHADRYPKEWIEASIEAGARLQLNAAALTLFARKRYIPWLESGKVVALGSDIHGADAKAYRRFVRAARFVSDYKSVTDFSNQLLAK